MKLTEIADISVALAEKIWANGGGSAEEKTRFAAAVFLRLVERMAFAESVTEMK